MIGFFSFAEAAAEAYGLGGAGTDTHAAADAFGVVGGFGYIYIHFACLCTFSAGNAFVFIHFHSEKGYLVKQRIKCAQRTQPLAERAVEKHTQQDYRDQNAELPRKERTECGAYAGIDGGERYRSLKYPLRAKVLAEEWVSHTDIVCDKHRHQNHHKKQNRVFYVGQRLQLFGGDLFGRNFVQQLLKPSERTQKTADEAAEQHTEQNEKARDVVGKAEFRRSNHCLE